MAGNHERDGRLPAVAALLDAHEPVGIEPVVEWAPGFPVRVSGYAGHPVEGFPDEAVSSIRCMVVVDDAMVFCETRDGEQHAMPGGRREVGETFAETAVREVHEETGWHLDPTSLAPVGWLHVELLGERPDPTLGPYPDLVQPVFVGRAFDRDGGRDNPWADVEGQEVSSRLVPLDEAPSIGTGSVEGPFVRLAIEALGRS